MRTYLKTAIAAVGIIGLLATGPVALANEDDVIKEGSCSAGSDWKLKLSPENGKTEVEFEVDQNTVGDTWRVKIAQNGERIFRGKRVTKAPSGSFELRIVAANPPGTDSYRASATNLSTGETCVGRASISV